MLFFKVDDVLLSNSSVANKGFVNIATKLNGTHSVCWESLKNNASDVICHQMAYTSLAFYFNKPVPSGSRTDVIFSGSTDCNGEEKDLSQCSGTSSSRSCSFLSYIKFEFFREYKFDSTPITRYYIEMSVTHSWKTE